eukprot:gene12336-biopygen3640
MGHFYLRRSPVLPTTPPPPPPPPRPPLQILHNDCHRSREQWDKYWSQHPCALQRCARCCGHPHLYTSLRSVPAKRDTAPLRGHDLTKSGHIQWRIRGSHRRTFKGMRDQAAVLRPGRFEC